MDDANREKARSITEAWGLSDQQRKQLLDQEDAAGSQIVMIHDSLHRIFGDREQADSWIKKPNQTFEGESALDVMLAGDIEKVRSYLRYYVYSA